MDKGGKITVRKSDHARIIRLHIRMQNISSDFESENYLYNETFAAKSIGQNYHELPRNAFSPDPYIILG